MAGKKSGTVGVVLGSGAVLLVVYLVWRLISAPKARAATSGGGYYGGGGSGTYSPANYPQQQSGLGSLLSNLLKALGGGGSSKSGGSSGGGSSSSAAKAPAAQTQSQLQQEMQAIAGYSSQANSAPNFVDLGGYSLNTLPPGYDASGVDLSGYSIPYQQMQNFDFGSGSYGAMQDLAGYQSYGGAIDQMSTADYTDLGYLSGSDF